MASNWITDGRTDSDLEKPRPRITMAGVILASARGNFVGLRHVGSSPVLMWAELYIAEQSSKDRITQCLRKVRNGRILGFTFSHVFPVFYVVSDLSVFLQSRCAKSKLVFVCLGG